MKEPIFIAKTKALGMDLAPSSRDGEVLPTNESCGARQQTMPGIESVQ
jgi:hypothetical protein